jgi:DNA transformation protein
MGQASYRRLPAFVLDDEDALAVWGRKAWEAARRARGASGD